VYAASAIARDHDHPSTAKAAIDLKPEGASGRPDSKRQMGDEFRSGRQSVPPRSTAPEETT